MKLESVLLKPSTIFQKVIPKDGDNTTEEAIESRVNDMALEIESIIHENFSGKAYPTEARRILFVLKSILCKKYLIGPLLLRMLFINSPRNQCRYC